jgi:hypothetical protein
MKTEDEIILSALEREHGRLLKIADQARKKLDARLNACSRLIEFRQEILEILHGPVDKTALAKIKELDKSSSETKKLLKLDIIKLMDKEHEAQWECDLAAAALARHRFRINIKKNG